MRKITVLLLAVAAALSLAATASADVPNAGKYVNETSNGLHAYCDTPASLGVATPGMPGAWGDFVDGCTSPKVTCPRSSRRGCPITLSSYIWSTDEPPYVKVTQNARVRVFNAGTGRIAWFRDKSCAGERNSCENRDSAVLRAGQSATYQCNGVREHTPIGEPMVNVCSVSIKLR